MNTTQLFIEGFKSGKLKEGKCPISSCKSNETILYRLVLTNETIYICGSCLDRLGKILK